MAFSKITIDFQTIPSVDSFLAISETSYGILLNETFKEIRSANYQVTLPIFEPDDGIHPDRWFGNVATNFKNAFNLDHNTTNLFTVVATPLANGLGKVEITANFSNAVFAETANNSGAIITIQNEVETPAITIDGVVYSAADTDQCNKVKLNITTSVLATIVNGLPNTNNPFTYELSRGISSIINVTDVNGKTAAKTVSLPKKLSSSNTIVKIINSPSGATATTTITQVEGLVLQYSLDNVTFQSSNIFSGLTSGNYTIYIKDQLGCSIQKDFIVTSFDEVGIGAGVNVPYAALPSKANSIRFKKVVEWGVSDNYKSDENTLSYEVDVKLPDTEIQKFQSSDTITTQIRSNFKNIDVKVLKCDLTEDNIPIVKKSNFIGLKDKRDAIKYNLGNGLTGIYFVSGNKYNFDTEIIDEPYALNGAVPEWAYVGNYLIIDNVWYIIEDVIFDETKLAEVIIISNVFTGTDTNIIVGSIYNLFNYNIYEFSIDMSVYLDKKIQVKITETDPKFETVQFLSEVIDVKLKQENTIEIVYFNDTNTDINYSTGIVHKIRIPYISKKGKSEDEHEIHDTDTDSILLSASLREGEEFIFEPVTKEIWRKLMIALSHNNVIINGIMYVKNGNFNTEGPLGDTDSYVLTAVMKKTGNVYSSQGTESVIPEESYGEIPNLLYAGDYLIKA
ncbi:MAG: hypothetical protein KGZ87_08910 [Bacteroidetes bacterium]|nr:hypothetical protein [Bacteroidota bacterium]